MTVTLDVSWMDAARCRGVDTDVFFPTRGEDVSIAKSYCAACTVRPQCLEYALYTGEAFGCIRRRDRSELATPTALRITTKPVDLDDNDACFTVTTLPPKTVAESCTTPEERLALARRCADAVEHLGKVIALLHLKSRRAS